MNRDLLDSFISNDGWVYRTLLDNVDNWDCSYEQFLAFIGTMPKMLLDEYYDTIGILLIGYIDEYPKYVSSEIYKYRDGILYKNKISRYWKRKMVFEYDIYRLFIGEWERVPGHNFVIPFNEKIDIGFDNWFRVSTRVVDNQEQLLELAPELEYNIYYGMPEPITPMTKSARKC